MIKPYGILGFTLGLMLSGWSAQAQEQSDSLAEMQSQSQALPIPLPVEIIESQSTSDARMRSEGEATEREIRDLAAQEGVNRATQEMNEATQRMAQYALWSTATVVIGTVLLFWTLWETRQANRAAVRAVSVTEDIGRKQLRPYVDVGDARIEGESFNYSVVCPLENFGQTPARNFRYKLHIGYADEPIPDFAEMQWKPIAGVPLAPRAVFNVVQAHIDLGEAAKRATSASDPLVRIVGVAEYLDHEDKRRETAFRLRIDPRQTLVEAPTISPENEGNYST